MAPSNELSETPDSVRPGLSPLSSQPNTMAPSASPRSASKVVFAEPDSISPLMKGRHKELDQSEHLDLDKTAKQFRASMNKRRLSGRLSFERLGSAAKSSVVGNPSLSSLLSEESDISANSPKERHGHESLVKQVTAWLKHEKTRRAARRSKRKATGPDSSRDAAHSEHPSTDETAAHSSHTTASRRGSESSEGSVALEHLASILERTLSLKSTEASSQKRRSSHAHKLSGIMKRHSVVSSDTDYFEGADELVPSCEAVLDNSKTMAYGAGGAESTDDLGSSANSTRKAKKEKDAWATFKYEIVRLAHTLKLKGWRRMPLERSNEISVERLSGALTNAVYVVSPPANLQSETERKVDYPAPKNPPPKLLLRIYGPQVEHLIDRESELQILRRLARKRIGPRLLGTFTNGRFEEFFYAKTLTPQDLRTPDTSKQIAKRMRELHEGIDLLRREREDGPFVWRNWDKWVDRCDQIVTWLDQQVREGRTSSSDPWSKLGLICGVEWSFFRQTIEKYRRWLEEQYGGIQKISERLVFAHNDTQYGNILRLEPAGESPLLLPANEHKQLVVIDFEYANANLPGLEFANHFTEWCYNYHDADKPYACNTAYYPTPEEQYRFVHAYLMHNPTFKAPGGSASNPPTPHLGPMPSSGSTTALAATAAPTSISGFMLDSRAPRGERVSYQEQEAQAEQRTEGEARRLMAETRLWRLANSAQWTAWGIVQANIPGLPDFDKEKQNEDDDADESKQGKDLDSATLEVKAEAQKESSTEENANDGEGDAAQDEEEEFDYLSYAQERAMFVWGDAIRLGIIKAEELPEDVLKMVKLIDY